MASEAEVGGLRRRPRRRAATPGSRGLKERQVLEVEAPYRDAIIASGKKAALDPGRARALLAVPEQGPDSRGAAEGRAADPGGRARGGVPPARGRRGRRRKTPPPHAGRLRLLVRDQGGPGRRIPRPPAHAHGADRQVKAEAPETFASLRRGDLRMTSALVVANRARPGVVLADAARLGLRRPTRSGRPSSTTGRRLALARLDHPGGQPGDGDASSSTGSGTTTSAGASSRRPSDFGVRGEAALAPGAARLARRPSSSLRAGG